MMATTQTDGDGRATCPLCSDYTGPPSSVEAHISRKTDPVHVGEVGRAHRDDLQRQVGEVRRSDPTDAPSEGGDGTDSAARDGDVEETSDGVDDGQPDGVDDDQRRPDLEDDDFADLPAEVAETGGGVDGDQQGGVDGDGSAGAVTATGAAGAGLMADALDRGITTWHVLGVIVVIGAVWLVLQSSSSSSSETVDDQEASDDQENNDVEPGEVWA